ncbi:nitroreductase family protein, partial [Mycobacterium kansasii]
MAFEPGAEISDDALDTILDAGRLAPSAGNSQPWAFVVGRRGDAVHARIVRHLAGSSARWAPDASAIVVNLAR